MSSLDLSEFVIRPITPDDVGALKELAQSLGPGMTTLPADKAVLARKAENSAASFRGEACDDPQYLLGLCKLENPRKLLGVSGVYPNVGTKLGFFSYHVGSLIQRSRLSDDAARMQVLSIDNSYTGATEVGSLAVHPSLRGRGVGKLLARARYLLIAAAPDRFGARVIAEMRGWQEEDGRSPFWDAVGRKFFDVDFPTADRLSAVEGAAYFADIWPKLAIYSALLPLDAQRTIGRAHRTSQLAMNMLLEEGFLYENMIDLFDAGPQVSVCANGIATIKGSRCVQARDLPVIPLLMSTTEIGRFRAWLGMAKNAGAALDVSGDDVARGVCWR
ncbi:MAG: arginine N-succinyltransferase [Hyphomonadaceae bacterium]|nr:arginine N-succinyltransferase [Hyphomonadaceae bacterium]